MRFISRIGYKIKEAFKSLGGDTVSSYTCGRRERQKDLAKLYNFNDKVKCH